MPPKPKSKKTAKPKRVTTVKAVAKASNKTQVVVNVTAPDRRKRRSKPKAVLEMPPSRPLNTRASPLETASPYTQFPPSGLEGIRAEVANLRGDVQRATIQATMPTAIAQQPSENMMTPSRPPRPSESLLRKAQSGRKNLEDELERAYVNEAYGPTPPSLPRQEAPPAVAAVEKEVVARRGGRPRAGEEGTVINPKTGATIRVGGKIYNELVREGLL